MTSMLSSTLLGDLQQQPTQGGQQPQMLPVYLPMYQYSQQPQVLQPAQGGQQPQMLQAYLPTFQSGSVNNNWLDIYYWVEDLVKKFQKYGFSELPKLRISFILYSDHGTTLLPLTADRKKIQEGLKELKAVVPVGATYMDKGFEMANNQIAKATAGGKKVSSMIIAFTDGTLEPVVFSNTKSEAQKARHMGATIYAVGVKDFLQLQVIRTGTQGLLLSLGGGRCQRLLSQASPGMVS
ncbi:anthrax toxin receptor 2-like [Dasypus novemcinctus]|uniref:anthrax toxin receptor 2-like n=1 Tax=Dasypus novemcinctus TaxID=9361 RepID=UPI00266021F2|nr:anthrax toxin receptor 2-like [Dasypus novemcinctus]